jgi:hypothetical protein
MRCLAFAALLLAAASAAGAEPTPLLSIALNADIRSIELARFPGYQSLPGARNGAAGDRDRRDEGGRGTGRRHADPVLGGAAAADRDPLLSDVRVRQALAFDSSLWGVWKEP